MPDVPQRWLTITQICTTLMLPSSTIRAMVKRRELVCIGSGTGKRYLDPTPEYAERLRIGYGLFMRGTNWQENIPAQALFTAQEISLLTGWTPKYAWKKICELKLPRVKLGYYTLFSAETVRNLIWNIKGKKYASKRTPFLLQELIKFFLEYKAVEDEETPTDADFARDDLIQRKLSRMARMKSPQRELAMKEFMDKVELAKTVAESLRKPA